MKTGHRWILRWPHARRPTSERTKRAVSLIVLPALLRSINKLPLGRRRFFAILRFILSGKLLLEIWVTNEAL